MAQIYNAFVRDLTRFTPGNEVAQAELERRIRAEERAQREFCFFQRNVYGTFKIYPGNENADRFAKLMKVKTFHPGDLDDIELLGFRVIEVPDPRSIKRHA